MATPFEHAHYRTKWLIRHTHSQNARCTHPQFNRFPTDVRAPKWSGFILELLKVSGHGSLELAQENRKNERKKERKKKERMRNSYFFEHLVLAYTIELMDDLGLVG